MEHDVVRDGVHDLDTVLVAACASLKARGVRVYMASLRQADGAWTEPWSWRVGVCDPDARASRLRYFFAEDSPVTKLSEAAAKAWPCLGEDAPSGPGPRTGEEMIEVGRMRYYGGPRRWMDWSDHESYGPNRALWALEAIQGSVTARLVGSVDVRGELCEQYVCDVRPAGIAHTGGIQLVDPPEPRDAWRVIDANVSVDSGGLVRRIMWSERFGAIFRPGLVPRLLAREDHPVAYDGGFSDSGRLWHVIELWDYSCEVEIRAPTEFAGKVPLRHAVRDLWRKRRKYKQRTKHPRPIRES
jgi:hypothetical protein